MSPETIFDLHLLLGYVAWLLCFTMSMPGPGSRPWTQSQRNAPLPHCTAFASLGWFSSFLELLVNICPPALPRLRHMGTLQPEFSRFLCLQQ